MGIPCEGEHVLKLKDETLVFKNSTEFKAWLVQGGFERLVKEGYYDLPEAKATPEEQLKGKPEKMTTAIKKAVVENETGWSHDIEKLRKTHPGIVDSAQKAIRKKEIDPRQLAILHSNDPTRPASLVDQAALLIDRMRIKKERTYLNEQIEIATKEGDTDKVRALEKKLDEITIQFNDNSQAALNIGTFFGQGLGFRRAIIADDFSLETQEINWRKDNPGKTVTEDLRKKWEEREKEFKDALDKIEKEHEAALKEAGNQAIENFKEALKREQEKKQTAANEKKIKQAFENAANAIRKGKTSGRPGIFSAATPGSLVWDGAIEISATVVSKTGDIAQALADGIKYIKESDWYKSLSDDKKQEAEKGFEDYVTNKTESLKKEDLTQKEKIVISEDLKVTIDPSVVEDYIKQGYDDIEVITDLIYQDLVKEYPDITHREIRDAITNYGETINMPENKLKETLRELKRIGRLISGIEDARSGKAPLKTGLQRDPISDKVRQLMKELRAAMKDIPIEATDLEKRYKTSLENIKTRLSNEIKDLNRQIEEGRDEAKKKGVDYDEEASLLVKERDSLKAELDRKFPKNPPSDAERAEQLYKILTGHYNKLSKEVESAKLGIFTKPEKKGYPESFKTKEMRDKIKAKKEELKKLKDEHGETLRKELETRLKAINTRQKKLQEKLDNRDFSTKPKKSWFDLSENERIARGKYEELKERYEEEREVDRLKNRTATQKYYDYAVEFLGLGKALVASFDASAPFRQGVFLLGRYPLTFSKNFLKQFVFMGSEEKYNKWMTNLKGSDLYNIIKESGLYVADNNAKLSAREEQFVSQIPKKIPIYKTFYKASERSYSGFLNKMRVDIFADFYDQLSKDKTLSNEQIQAELKGMAKFLNSATGRAELGKKAELMAPLLNSVFFSPRFVTSRIDLINPVFYLSLPPKAKRKAFESAIAFVGTGLVVMGVAKLAGADVEDDPNATDFGKIIIGDKRYDIWGGEADMVRFFVQGISGEIKHPTGEVEKLNTGKFMDRTRLGFIGRFARGKLSPSASFVTNYLEGKTYMGDPFSFKDEAIKYVLPLYISDMKGVLKEKGIGEAASVGIPSFFGIGVKIMKPKKKKGKGPGFGGGGGTKKGPGF